MEVIGRVEAIVPLVSGGRLVKVGIGAGGEHVFVLVMDKSIQFDGTVSLSGLACKTVILDGCKYYLLVFQHNSTIRSVPVEYGNASLNKKFIYTNTRPSTHCIQLGQEEFTVPCLYSTHDSRLVDTIVKEWTVRVATKTLYKYLSGVEINMLRLTFKQPKVSLADVLDTSNSDCNCWKWLVERLKRSLMCVIDGDGRAVTNTSTSRIISDITSECVVLLLDYTSVFPDLICATNVQILLSFDRKITADKHQIEDKKYSNIQQLPFNVSNDLIVSVRGMAGWMERVGERWCLVLVDAGNRADSCRLYFMDDERQLDLFKECIFLSKQIERIHTLVYIDQLVLRRGQSNGPPFLIMPLTASPTIKHVVEKKPDGPVRDCFTLDEIPRFCQPGEVVRCRVLVMSVLEETDKWRAVYKITDATMAIRLVVEKCEYIKSLNHSILCKWWTITATLLTKDCLLAVQLEPINVNSLVDCLLNIMNDRLSL